MDTPQLPPLSHEFADAALGDRRLTSRLMRIADLVASAPGSSFPKQADSAGELEGVYRFLENERVAPKAVLDPHVRATLKRAESHPEVLILHDTTEFEFGGEDHREGLGWLNYETRQGFLGHFSFAVAPDGEPLGTLELFAWTRQGKPKGRRSQQASQYDPDRESLRWTESALLSGQSLETPTIHVMDREGDCFELFSMLLEYDQRFVIRLSHDRRLRAGRETDPTKLFETLSDAPFLLERQVPVSSRGTRKRSGKLKTFPARRRRIAHLEVRATSKEIFSGHGAPAHVPDALTLQFVEVREIEPPEGEEPILWRLVTTEPVRTEAEVAKVIDAYCRRWLIEEFFKALKTGCRYQQRQLETAHALLVDLAIEVAVAWRLLLMRWLSREASEVPASRALSKTQLLALTTLMKSRGQSLRSDPTVQDALLAVAALGGHIKYNGAPGWLVLRRGWETLTMAEQIWTAMHHIQPEM